MTVNIIHLKEREDRWCKLQNELLEQGITDFKIWDGVRHETQTYIGIARAHKRIVIDAKSRGLEECIIMEDDCRFYGRGAFDYFVNNKPADYDLYLGNVFDGHINADNTVHVFSGMTLYFIHNKFYDTFLNISDAGNIDRMLEGKGKYVVCDPFVVTQTGGYSDNRKSIVESYDYKLVGRRLFKPEDYASKS